MDGEAKADGGGPERTAPKASTVAGLDPREETPGSLGVSLAGGDIGCCDKSQTKDPQRCRSSALTDRSPYLSLIAAT